MIYGPCPYYNKPHIVTCGIQYTDELIGDPPGACDSVRYSLSIDISLCSLQLVVIRRSFSNQWGYVGMKPQYQPTPLHPDQTGPSRLHGEIRPDRAPPRLTAAVTAQPNRPYSGLASPAGPVNFFFHPFLTVENPSYFKPTSVSQPEGNHPFPLLSCSSRLPSFLPCSICIPLSLT